MKQKIPTASVACSALQHHSQVPQRILCVTIITLPGAKRRCSRKEGSFWCELSGSGSRVDIKLGCLKIEKQQKCETPHTQTHTFLLYLPHGKLKFTELQAFPYDPTSKTEHVIRAIFLEWWEWCNMVSAVVNLTAWIGTVPTVGHLAYRATMQTPPVLLQGCC